MSYILNALKKAEHDRKREEPEDLDDFVSAGWDPYEEAPKKNSAYMLAIIIVAIAMLLFYGFYNLTNQNIGDAVLADEPQQAVADPVIQQTVVLEEESLIEEAVVEKIGAEKIGAKKTVIEELQLPEVTIAGHIYIRSGSEKNRIFIGDRTYYVGDSIDSNWVIESINFDSLNIRSGAQSTEIPLR